VEALGIEQFYKDVERAQAAENARVRAAREVKEQNRRDRESVRVRAEKDKVDQEVAAALKRAQAAENARRHAKHAVEQQEAGADLKPEMLSRLGRMTQRRLDLVAAAVEEVPMRAAAVSRGAAVGARERGGAFRFSKPTNTQTGHWFEYVSKWKGRHGPLCAKLGMKLKSEFQTLFSLVHISPPNERQGIVQFSSDPAFFVIPIRQYADRIDVALMTSVDGLVIPHGGETLVFHPEKYSEFTIHVRVIQRDALETILSVKLYRDGKENYNGIGFASTRGKNPVTVLWHGHIKSRSVRGFFELLGTIFSNYKVQDNGMGIEDLRTKFAQTMGFLPLQPIESWKDFGQATDPFSQ
jgi:hypothetical protein